MVWCAMYLKTDTIWQNIISTELAVCLSYHEMKSFVISKFKAEESTWVPGATGALAQSSFLWIKAEPNLTHWD